MPFITLGNAFNYYCLQHSCGKIMFLHLSVSHSVHRGVYPSMHWGRRPPGRHIPACTGADTPRGRHPLGRRLQADTPRQTPPKQTPPGRHPPGRHPPGRHPHPGQMATAADGTHPTGMHSCLEITVWSNTLIFILV